MAGDGRAAMATSRLDVIRVVAEAGGVVRQRQVGDVDVGSAAYLPTRTTM
jgi:hypothetical protein